ncbi:hypothetical protein bplSymb_SCF06304P007 [Bathymodiolus platifrons methanotrophic gill symbiont]|uniref:hypothetical protein n=1 Tax=Bathymodiolus platifrons methanotrophic gill symbiont TaxID=113268 RepID=UPI000B41C41B|nr:hypothetical protein [Bathymodiolus platifrons methanotrophic gill symbiont]GAW87196.1 hypothetical protein bplSymb_SCF06304P007 [Bathymodiolus platifrons methanotrophic gill symbiont]
MRIKILATLLMTVWVTTASAQGWEDDNAKVEYELSCDEQRARDPSMTDEEYSDSLLEVQDSECARVFKVGDIGFGGGRVFYTTDGGRHGMEIAPNHHTTVSYGCVNVALEGARDKSLGAGVSNTDVALAKNCVTFYGDTTIFYVLRNFDAGDLRDWYIPSYGELEEIYKVLGPYTVTEKGGAHPSIPQFFWSSSEDYKNMMSAFNLTTGQTGTAHKAVKLSVLLIRNF